MNKTFIHVYLNLFLIGSAIFANTIFEYKGELSILEFLQNFLLIMILFCQWRFRKLFFEFSNKVIFSIRCFLFLFILYEEMSFLTMDLSHIFNIINNQQEINFHNLNFLNQILINNFNLPFLDYQISISLPVFISTVVTILFGFGSYLPYINRTKFFFIEKEYSIYSTIYIVFVIVHSLNKYKFNNFLNVDYEFCELFLYNLFFVDLLIKIRKMKNLNSRLKINI